MIENSKFLNLVFVIYCSNAFGWTWSFSKKFELNSDTKLAFFNSRSANFRQLIFSWNAIRPKVGFFRFYTKVHTADGWTKWFKMADWGANIQKSYLTKIGDFAYHHVRLEVPKYKMADAFQIKVEAMEGADLSNLKYLNVSVSDLNKFFAENLKDIKNLKSVILKNIPAQSQMVIEHEDSNRICSPTSLSMMLGYLMKNRIDALDIAKNSFDQGLEAYGSWPFNIAHAFEVFPMCHFKVVRLKSFKNLYDYLIKGVPVVVSVRGNIDGAPQSYPQGHLMLVNGWNREKNRVHVYDPAFKKNSKVKHAYRLEDFLKAWERSHRLAYVVDC